jgi:16S rRNA (uracil1498-N3)-methyltransferase
MHRLFVTPQDITTNKVSVTGEALKKIRVVLRLKPGDTICIFDGTGWEYLSQVVSLTPSKGDLQILEKSYPVRESPLHIYLGQAIPKSTKMSLIVQKAVELGVTGIHPFYSARSVPHYSRDQVKRRIRRWQTISREASRQSGRTKIPPVHTPMDFPEILDAAPEESLKILLQKGTTSDSLRSLLRNERRDSIFFLIGPEGGFAPEEFSLCFDRGFRPVDLGTRTLRTETVAIAFLSILQYELGDIP